MRLLECSDLNMSYETVPALKDLSFFVDAGDYLCIIGENGSGKTTLLKGLLGLKEPDSGLIEYIGFTKREVGYMPQQTTIQKDFPASVMEVVLSGCLNREGFRVFYGKKDRELAVKNLETLSISDLAGKSYMELSGGQQQRVLLARALCATQRLLILDEPTISLDPVATSAFYGVVKSLNRDRNITIIMVSHDVSAAVQNASKILHLETTPLFFGSVEDYVNTDVGKRMLGAG